MTNIEKLTKVLTELGVKFNIVGLTKHQYIEIDTIENGQEESCEINFEFEDDRLDSVWVAHD